MYIILSIVLTVMILTNIPKFLEYEKIDVDIRKDYDLDDKKWNGLLDKMYFKTKDSYKLNKGHLVFLQNYRNITETGVDSSGEPVQKNKIFILE